jgi:hypothetical protein
MFESNPQTPLIDFKEGKLNLIHINLDNSESSTKESHISRENSKCLDDTLDIKNDQKKTKKPKKAKLIQLKTKGSILNKKTKREKNTGNSSKKNNKIKNGKYKIIFNLFNEFKTCSKLYKEFTQFHYIEKNIKNDLYSSTGELASEIRNIFSRIFSSFFDYDKYNKTLILCENFEKIYKKYDNKSLTKKCKNLAEIINKLKRELRQTELSRNIPAESKSYSNKNSNNFYSFSASKNKFHLNLNDSDNDTLPEKSVKKYKNEISNKINKLNNEQKRGILGIISNNCVDKNIQNNVMEINVNKMSLNQLKELDKYLNKCIKVNNLNITSLIEKKSEFSINKNFDEEKECDILKNDDLSSCLSDDEDEEDEE